MKTTATAAAQSWPTVRRSACSRLRQIVMASVFATVVLGTSPVQAKDSCETALCMWGMVTDSDDESCEGAIADYFDILVYKKRKINWNATADARLAFTNSCEGSDPDHNQEINDMFGKSRG